MNFKIFSDIMEALFTYTRITSSYETTPRTYGTEDFLYQTDVHVLQAIANNPGVNLNELADMTYRTKSAMSVLIKSLVEKGLVERKRDERDNRRYIITLTEKGMLVNQFHEKLDERNFKSLLECMLEKEDISIEDLKSTLKVLNALNKEMHDIHNLKKGSNCSSNK